MNNIACHDYFGHPLKHFYQWDANQTIKIDGEDITDVSEVHFCNIDSKEALVMSPTVTNAGVSVKVPNALLQCAKPIIIFLYRESTDAGLRTVGAIRIPVIPRVKPSDYVYSETEVMRYKKLDERIKALEDQSGGYYIPSVTQPQGDTMEISYTPSKEGMPEIPAKQIVLPAVVGPQGPPGLSGGFYTPSAQLTDYNSIIFKFTPSTIGLPEVEDVEIFLPASDSSGTGSSDSGRKLVAAIHYSNQQELTPTAIDPETGHITVAETVQADYWGWYCDDYFKFKVWEPSFDTANIPAKFLEGNGQPYAIERIDDHTVGLMKGHGAWGDPYDVPASLDLSLFTLIGTKTEEMPPVEGLNLQDFDLEAWGNHIRPHIYLYDDAGATIPVSKKDMIDVYNEKNFYNHLTLHRRGGVITGTISIVDATGTTNIRDLTFTIPPDAVVSKMQFARRYSPASEMNIRIYEVNGGAAGE